VRWVITSAKELRDGVFTEGEIPPHNLKAMNFKTHAKPNEDFGKRVIRSKKDMGDLERKSLIEGSFEIDQAQKNYETVTGLDRFNPKAVDPNSLDRLNPKAVEPNRHSNQDRTELHTLSPAGHNAPSRPIEDENTEPVDHLDFDLESLNVNQAMDPSNFINMDEFLGDIQDIKDMAKEIEAGGTQSGWFDDLAEGWDRFWDDDNRLGTEDEDDLTGWGDDLDGDGTPNWRDWDFHNGENKDSDGDGVNNNKDKDNNNPGIQIMAGQGKGGNLPPWVNAINIADTSEIHQHHQFSLLEPISSQVGPTLPTKDLSIMPHIQASDLSQPIPINAMGSIADM
tara:strand:- start:353 stop:1366 length:1014 start_codon:yes stop_codon:yes gene_type:complete